MGSSLDFSSLAQLDQDAIRCPYPTYAAFREDAAATYVPEIEAWLVTRYEEICKIARDPELYSSIMPTGPVASRQMAQGVQAVAAEDPELGAKLGQLRGTTKVLLFSDPPDHRRQRRLVARAFTPSRIREAEPDVRRMVERLADNLRDQRSVEFIGEFAVPLPLLVMAELLAIPAEMLPEFKRWSDEVVKVIGNSSMTVDELRQNMLAQYELFAYFGERLAERRSNPGDDLISVVITATDEDAPLTDAEVLNMLLQFLVAGNETTTKALGFGVRTLLERPDLVAALRADSSMIPAFVEETLRLDPPVQGLYRVATRDALIGDVAIKAGDSILLSWAGGNRDELQFPTPDELSLSESSTRQLAFGVGEHQCIGAPLARAELRIAFEVLLDRFDMSVPDGVDLDNLEFESSYILRGLKHLPVEFTSRSS